MSALTAPCAFAQANTPTTPLAAEMAALYEINRARSNPQAYDAEQGLGGVLAGILPAPPLALNERLVTSSRFHSDEMAVNGYFAHTSEITGNQPNLMVRNAGYPLASVLPDAANNLESLACLFTSSSGGISYAPAQAIRELILDQGVSPPGHRYHLLAWGGNQSTIDFYRRFRECGTGYAEGFRPEMPFSAATPPDGSGAYWSIHTGFRDSNTPWLCGVVYNDLNANGRYDAGEGLGGVAIGAVGPATLGTTTNAAGAYSLSAPPGNYTMVCNGGAFSGAAGASVSVAADNMWVEFRSGQTTGIVNFQVAPDIEVLLQPGTIVSQNGTLNLGNVPATAQNVNFTISNTGTAPLNLTGTPRVSVVPVFGSPTVSVSVQPAASVAIAASTSFTISLTPPATGFSFGVTIPNDDPDESPFVFTVVGNNSPAQAVPAPGSVVSGPPDGPFSVAFNPGAALANVTLQLVDAETDTITVSQIVAPSPSPAGFVTPAIPAPGSPLTLAWTGAAGASNPPGLYAWTIHFSDAGSGTARTATLTITINDVAPTHAISGASGGSGSAGNPYTATFAQGDGPALNVDLCAVSDANTSQALSLGTITPGANPGGTVFTFALASGQLRVSPSATLDLAHVGTHNFDVQVSDGTNVVTISVSLSVAGSSGAITFVTPAALPPGKSGRTYTPVTFSVNGAAPPVSFSVIAGSIPSGLALTGDSLSGTAGAAGSFSFTLRAMDSASDTATRQFTITIEPADPAKSDNGCTAGTGVALPFLAIIAAARRRRRRQAPQPRL